MKSLWQADARRELHERLAHLTPHQRAMWGKMNAAQMVVHLADAMRMTFGDLPVVSKGGPLRYPPLKQLLIYWLPWPQGVPTAPELLGRAPSSWTTDVSELDALIDRFGREDRKRAWPAHPAFGRLNARQWGALGYRHIDHHLRQFGA
jgi:hypothetical protein